MEMYDDAKKAGRAHEELFRIEHTLDLSFTKDANYGKRAGAVYDSDGE